MCCTPDLHPAPVETWHRVVTLPGTTSRHEVAGHLAMRQSTVALDRTGVSRPRAWTAGRDSVR